MPLVTDFLPGLVTLSGHEHDGVAICIRYGRVDCETPVGLDFEPGALGTREDPFDDGKGVLPPAGCRWSRRVDPHPGAAAAPISRRLPASRSPPQPKTMRISPFAMFLRDESTASSASGVWA